MKIVVLGLWHLGSVTAACCAKSFSVTGLDFDSKIVANLKNGKAPLFEPGLDSLISAGVERGTLQFTSDPVQACDGADVLWLCADTPVDQDDVSDVESVLDLLRRTIPYVALGKLVLISSQLPVGTCAMLEREFPQIQFACCPENLRLGSAIKVFAEADRYVLGIRSEEPKKLLEELFSPFSKEIVFVRTESAEMVKHAINSFLAMSISFINEISRICEWVGADAREVSKGLKTDVRIGPKAYLLPGGPFAGGTLARDVVTLTGIAESRNETIQLIPSIKRSNDAHRKWAFARLKSHMRELLGKTIALLGLTYKPGTDTLRRSAAIELCHDLQHAGCTVKAFDPLIANSSKELGDVILVHSIEDALAGVDAAVICTECLEFQSADWEKLVPTMASPVFVDANRFLDKQLLLIPNAKHLSVGQL